MRRRLLTTIVMTCVGLTGLTVASCGTQSQTSVPAFAQGPAVADQRMQGWTSQFCGATLNLDTAVKQMRVMPDLAGVRNPLEIQGKVSSALKERIDTLESTKAGYRQLSPAPVGGGDKIIDAVLGELDSVQGQLRHVKQRVDSVDFSDPRKIIPQARSIVDELRGIDASIDQRVFSTQIGVMLQDRAFRDATNKSAECKRLGEMVSAAMAAPQSAPPPAEQSQPPR